VSGAAPEPSAATAPAPEVTILVESFNHGEGSPLERLLATLRPAAAAAHAHGAAEILLADPVEDPELTATLAREAPEVRRIGVSGGSYDEAKMKAAAAARGRYVVFLDGDCIPVDEGWLTAHLRALRAGAGVSCGLTRYEGGLLQKALSVMDFGFLLPATEREVTCYASNNVGFERELLLACPIADGSMRCNCYAHAQELRRRGRPGLLTPDALVEHEIKPFWKERLRRGYDHVAAIWANPELPERRLLRLGPLAAPLFYAREAALDARRLASGWRAVGLSRAGAAAAFAVLPLLRLTDLVGLTRALATPRRRRPPGSDAPALQGEA
jgi:hypothetical protein